MTTTPPKKISSWRYWLIQRIAGRAFDPIVLPRHPNALIHAMVVVQMCATYGNLMRALAEGEEKERQEKMEAECQKVREDLQRAREELAGEVKIH